MKSIYIHIPFCIRKCFYCDFYSIEDTSIIENYINSLVKEILLYSDQFKNELIDTIFFGGGTPSILKTLELETILNTIYKNFNVSKNAEITIEANPGTIDLNKIKDIKSIGFNRISVGVQSFDDSELKFLQRIHNSSEAIRSIENILTSGFENFNIDLIFSIPGQTKEILQKSLDMTMSFNVPHISAYSLIYEEGTALYTQYKAGRINPLTDTEDSVLFYFLVDYLNNNNYEHYEISNYSMDGFKCKHNLNYWNGENYLGLGASAHSYVNQKRFKNFSDVMEYINYLEANKLPIEYTEEITKEKEMIETIMLGLRSEGIDLISFQKKFGISIMDKLANLIKDLKNENLLTVGNVIKLTKKGMFLADSIILKFLVELN